MSGAVQRTLDGALLLRRDWTDNSKLLHLVNQRCALHSQPFGGAVPTAHNPIARFERPDNMLSRNFRKPRHGQI